MYYIVFVKGQPPNDRRQGFRLPPTFSLLWLLAPTFYSRKTQQFRMPLFFSFPSFLLATFGNPRGNAGIFLFQNIGLLNCDYKYFRFVGGGNYFVDAQYKAFFG
ncbi:MAG: hypothetical protein FWG18_02535, partial [Alphaproteobacteria bacterium]|nr:hypothetical protein [Alphaproteobacteria bacterium]